MKEREAFEFEETKRRLLAEHPWCEVCGKRPSVQLAHRIAKSKPNLKRYGAAIIHHPKNVVCVCASRFGFCNDSVNIGNRPMAVAKLVAEIQDARRNMV